MKLSRCFNISQTFVNNLIKRSCLLPSVLSAQFKHKEISYLPVTPGNEQFKRGEYDAAVKLYSEGLDLLEGKTCQESAVILKNRAACYLKLGFYHSRLPGFKITIDCFLRFITMECFSVSVRCFFFINIISESQRINLLIKGWLILLHFHSTEKLSPNYLHLLSHSRRKLRRSSRRH